jgi:hypothetical protein
MTDKQINVNITLINDLVNVKNRFLKKVYVNGEHVGWMQPALTYDDNMNIIDNPDNREGLRMIGEDDYLDNRRPDQLERKR